MVTASLVMALREIRRNLMRSGLTMLGVVIGVAAVVALVSIGQGASASVTSSIADIGQKMLTVSPVGFSPTRNFPSYTGQTTTLNRSKI
jgi:putative ABC transport system permease protein